ncbi:hypothetical protein GOODEAATRI_004056 [Goodea atripinnis]|uniref:Uncharacterized protein n=1 Tax=Goodea atripinnis TaxID=208336 RepID=A0ABV0NTB1_9TELE
MRSAIRSAPDGPTNSSGNLMPQRRPSAEEHFWHNNSMTSLFFVFPASISSTPPVSLQLCSVICNEQELSDIVVSFYNWRCRLTFCGREQLFFFPPNLIL